MTKAVIIQLPNGAEYGLASVADAKRVYPDATILRYEDGTEYTEPKAATPKKAASKKDDAK